MFCTDRQTDILPLQRRANVVNKQTRVKNKSVLSFRWHTCSEPPSCQTSIRANFPIRRWSKTARVHSFTRPCCFGKCPLASHHRPTPLSPSWCQQTSCEISSPYKTITEDDQSCRSLRAFLIKNGGIQMESGETILQQSSLPPARTQSLLKQSSSLKFH